MRRMVRLTARILGAKVLGQVLGVKVLGQVLLIGTGAAAFAAEAPSSLASLVARKEVMASELARQVAFCSARHDTNHPAFHGCIDWHSAVHGVWALTAYEQATGDRQYAPLVASILTADGLHREREHLRQAPQFEMPYGRAWFLRLAIDHHMLTGSKDLTPFADEVALSLRDYYRQRPIDRLSGAYNSASWALINLIDYASHRKLKDLHAETAGWIKQSFGTVEKCPYEAERGEFMAICTNQAALVARALDRDDYAKWLDAFIALNGLPVPIADPAGAHEFGLNFSRAWGLWDMYAKSGRADIVDAYAAHFHRGFTPASNWSGNYGAVGHWVAQFGMFALQPLFGPKLGR